MRHVRSVTRNCAAPSGRTRARRPRTVLWVALLLALAAPLAAQQVLPIGIVDFYGLRRVSESDARRALGIAEGDSLVPDSMAPALRRLRALPGVADARLTPVCCESDGRWALFVGVAEHGAPAVALDSAPHGAVRLPDAIVRLGAALQDTLLAAVQRGQSAEHDSAGHAFFDEPGLHAIQEQFLAYAAANVPELIAVLHRSGDAAHRALAAELLGYAPDVGQVVPDLVQAVHDADGDVRNNAMRALLVIAAWAQQHPETGIRVPATPFIDMLNSLVWTDRNKSSYALYELTASRDSSLLAELRAQALPALLDIARWRSVGHAFVGYMVLGRIEGVPDETLQEAWRRGDRRQVIDAAVRIIAADGSD